jgi:hypothetical protein
MAAQKLLGRLGQLGIGLVVAGGVAQSALYNGTLNLLSSIYFTFLIFIFQSREVSVP